MLMKQLRHEYHREICEQLLSVDTNGIPNNADKHSNISVTLAKGLVEKIGFSIGQKKAPGQTAGKLFEKLTTNYLEKAFSHINHLHPGDWLFIMGKKIKDVEQYEHLALLAETLKENKELRATLGDYLIHPDIVVGRYPVTDDEINRNEQLLSSDKSIANLTPLRKQNSSKLILHAQYFM